MASQTPVETQASAGQEAFPVDLRVLGGGLSEMNTNKYSLMPRTPTNTHQQWGPGHAFSAGKVDKVG